MNTETLGRFFQTYLGAKYIWWNEGDPIGQESPFYSLPKESQIPTVKEVCEKGINCTGLLNLGRLACGLDGCYGTPSYEEKFSWRELKTEQIPPVGATLLRKYYDCKDQGHVGYMLNTQEIIHSCDFDEKETGVCISKYSDWSSYFTHWAPFEEVFLNN